MNGKPHRVLKPKSLSAFVDFECDLSLRDVAALLSRELFADIPFTGENSGIWDEVPAVRLSKRLLSCEVQLGGHPSSGYTLQILSEEFPWERVDTSLPSEKHVLDITDTIAVQMEQLPGIQIIAPQY